MLIDTASPRSRESVCPLNAVGAVCCRSGTDCILLVSGWCPPSVGVRGTQCCGCRRCRLIRTADDGRGGTKVVYESYRNRDTAAVTITDSLLAHRPHCCERSADSMRHR